MDVLTVVIGGVLILALVWLMASECRRGRRRRVRKIKRGPEGPPGEKGDPGKNGSNGTNGTNGTNGPSGTSGTSGTNGTDGLGFETQYTSGVGGVVLNTTAGGIANAGAAIGPGANVVIATVANSITLPITGPITGIVSGTPVSIHLAGIQANFQLTAAATLGTNATSVQVQAQVYTSSGTTGTVPTFAPIGPLISVGVAFTSTLGAGSILASATTTFTPINVPAGSLIVVVFSVIAQGAPTALSTVAGNAGASLLWTF